MKTHLIKNNIMKKKVFVVAAALAFSAFQGWSKENYKQEQFVNLLNIEVGYEAAPRGYFFSDLGGWHGYGFNSSADLQAVSEDRLLWENAVWDCSGCPMALRS